MLQLLNITLITRAGGDCSIYTWVLNMKRQDLLNFNRGSLLLLPKKIFRNRTKVKLFIQKSA